MCLAESSAVSGGRNNTILEEKLREDNYKIPLWVHIQSLVVQQTKFNVLVPVRPSQEDPLTPSPIDVNTLQLLEAQVNVVVVVVVVAAVHQ